MPLRQPKKNEVFRALVAVAKAAGSLDSTVLATRLAPPQPSTSSTQTARLFVGRASGARVQKLAELFDELVAVEAEESAPTSGPKKASARV
ncbi:hypothetical protein BH09MYX1_BH09MYX1_09370 [soil metagenome]